MRANSCAALLRAATAVTSVTCSAPHPAALLQLCGSVAIAPWSAAVGNCQLPWHLCLQAGHQQYALSTAVDTAAAAAAAAETTSPVEPKLTDGSPGSSSSSSDVQQTPTQQQQAALNFDEGPQQLHAAQAAAAATAFRTPGTPVQLQQQQQQLGQVPRSPINSASTAAPSFRLPSNIALQDLSLSPSDSGETTNSALQLLLGQVCTYVHSSTAPFAPFQIDPTPSLQQLEQQEKMCLRGQRGFRFREEAYTTLTSLLNSFVKSPQVREVARGAHIPKALGPQATVSFRRYIQRSATPGLLAALIVAGAQQQPAALTTSNSSSPRALRDVAAAIRISSSSSSSIDAVPTYTPEVEQLLMPLFLEYCNQHYAQEIATYAAAVATLDLRTPHTWYPFARAIKRKIVYHGGPTNSGKTYNALQSLAAAERGIYCAPLRLLAMEVYETLNHRGVYCNLVTGQEVMHVSGSNHTSCTVEMANINAHCDVAVIDEIQLIGDQQRGFAWSRALLGIPANTIHVCGDTSAVALVRHLAGLCGDEFEVHSYERMTPLKLDPQGLPNGLADVQPGDAVVAFNRRSIYNARRDIESATGHKTCIVYGALPAETRRHQARLFNNPASGVNVLIASDAIGLGLNFNIRRVIFTTLTKRARGGKSIVKVPVTLIKQIAGRAGRRNSIYPEGCVTTLDPNDLPYLRTALEAPASSLYTPAAGLAPELETVELLSSQFPELSLEELLKKLDAEARLDGRYFLCKQEQMLETARVLRWVKGLSLQDQFTLVNAPIDVYNDIHRGAFIDFARTYASGQPVLFNEALMPKGPPRTEYDMQQAEDLHKIMGCWLWLSYRFEEGTFPGRERVQALSRQLCEWLNTGLEHIQTTEELLEAAAAAAAAAKAAAAAADAEVAFEAPTPSQATQQLLQAAAAAAGAGVGVGAGPTVGSGTPAAAEAEAAADSSDVDEYNDAAFTVRVDEAPLTAADRGYDGELEAPAAAAAADGSASLAEVHLELAPAAEAAGATGSAAIGAAAGAETWSSASSNSSSSSVVGTAGDGSSSISSTEGTGSMLGFKLSKRELLKLKKLQPPYIQWTSAIASGPAMAAYNASSSSSSSSSSVPASPQGSMLETLLAGGAMGDLELLLMPEFEPSMAPYVRWKLRPRFQVPAPPVKQELRGQQQQ